VDPACLFDDCVCANGGYLSLTRCDRYFRVNNCAYNHLHVTSNNTVRADHDKVVDGVGSLMVVTESPIKVEIQFEIVW